MNADLDRLSIAAGIVRTYTTLDGGTAHVSDAAVRGLLRAMGIACDSDAEVAASLESHRPLALGPLAVPEGVRCYIPEWLREGRCWGVTCQLYGLRSARNWGIGDFEDLARFAEIVAGAGGDFLGVNPLHALLFAAPEGCSPFWPSHRRYLNPMYIAVDRVPGAERFGEALGPLDSVRNSELIDYAAVGGLKRSALGDLYRIFAGEGDRGLVADFHSFVAEEGESLHLHALFEALSETMVEDGHAATWPGWREGYRHPANDAVKRFARDRHDLVMFHCWLQWVAARQLAEAQTRARAAGMRIGLYLDFAVGVAPDGSATWSDRALLVPGARIGAPPDYFNAAGQDWGLSPISPSVLAERHFQPIRDALDTVLAHAGALRIDHAMSLCRLFWIAHGFAAADGAYVRYPFADLVRTMAEVSQRRQAVVIGEDLGVVPEGFRAAMHAADIQSYRVLFFEKRDDHFLPASAYPREALACITTHDTQTFAGWWSGHDLSTRAGIGMIPPEVMAAEYDFRAHERRRLLGLLETHALLPPELEPVMRAKAEPPLAVPDSLVIAIHRFIARTPSRLVAASADDLVGALDQVNIPGTVNEHPNWRRKLGVALEDIAAHPIFAAVAAALGEERPKNG
ncbi:MAG TPA: 4-alpha-glucanotransferase [Bauldia sp.]|nr:4-alpha-glucanotransferase [Bauldia sp.]